MELEKVPYLEGWGLHVAYRLVGLGALTEVGSVKGCRRKRCSHFTHDPAAPHRRWAPYYGTLYRLGRDEDYVYYILRINEEDLYLRYRPAGAYHASIAPVDPARVPDLLRTGEEERP